MTSSSEHLMMTVRKELMCCNESTLSHSTNKSGFFSKPIFVTTNQFRVLSFVKRGSFFNP